jgi:SAM-dependent methyltransferase
MAKGRKSSGGKREEKGQGKGRRKGKGRKGKRKGTLAAAADRYDLYQRSVQEPECEIEFFDRVYLAIHGRPPRVLREDFCGTFAVSCEWAKKPGRVAYALDLDPEPLAWGRERNLARLDPEAQARVHPLEADVRSDAPEKADVIAAQNFSFWVWKTRAELRTYFEAARRNLAEGGLLVLDLMGGGDCWKEGHVDKRKYEGFRYEWEQERFDPISHHVRMKIHYAFKDGSRIDDAFVYDWRFWTLPEVREVLAEAGFSQSVVYWEGEEEDGEGDGRFDPVETAENDPTWIAYLVARA